MLRINLEIGSVSTLQDKSCKVVCYTPELPPEAMTELFTLQKEGLCAAVFQGAKNEKTVDALGIPSEGKTPSQRLRAVLYVWWEQKYQGTISFDDFYKKHIEKIIEGVKIKLEENKQSNSII